MNQIAKTKEIIEQTLRTGRPIVVPYSGGRDSSSVLNLTVSAAGRLKALGIKLAPIFVINADTMIENPEVCLVLDRSLKDLRQYCANTGIDLSISQSRPALNSEWMVKILSGRNLPIFANRKHRDCSVDLKITPMERLKKKLLKTIREDYGEPITMVGTRYAEGAGRRQRMEARGESAETVWSNDQSGDMLSPIAEWADADIWTYLQGVVKGQEEGFTDFSDLIHMYWTGTELSEGHTSPSCRFGCSVCTVGRDCSMENMLKNDPDRYGYMAGINQLQRYLVATQYDFSKRQWIGRTIHNGYLAIYPDTYGPQMLEDLFLMILTLDAREQEAAYRLGIEPRFQLLHPRAIIAIDALWSMQGSHLPFHGLYLFDQVYNKGLRKEIPEIEATPQTPVPAKRYLHVGDAWKDSTEFAACGLRNVSVEMSCDSDSFSGCGRTETLNDGRIVMDCLYSEDGLFDVDEESAMMVLGMELDYLLRNYHNTGYKNTYGYNLYATMGVLQLSSRRQTGTSDFILRRTAFREKLGLIGGKFDLEAVLKQTISEREFKRLTTGDMKVRSVEEQTQMDLFEEIAA